LFKLYFDIKFTHPKNFGLAIEVIREMDDMFDEGKEGENVIAYLFQ